MVAVVLVAHAPTALATFPGANGKIAYVNNLDNRILVVNPDGSGLTPAYTCASCFYVASPSFSPDGTKIALIRDSQVYVMNADGSNLTPVLTDDGNRNDVAFHADGTSVVFSQYEVFDEGGGNFRAVANIRRVPLTGGVPADITLQQGTIQDYFPTVAEDGRVAFTRDPVVSGHRGDLYVGGTLLTSPAPAVDWAPSFSPDSGSIVFQRSAPGPFPSDVYVVNSTGGTATPLTTGGYSGYPVFSPDGTKIAYVSDPPDDSYGKQIWVMNADGTNKTRITSAGGQNPQNLTWQPIPQDAPEIEALTFRHPDIPSGALEAVGDRGTIDGNTVEVTARVRNPQGTSRNLTLRFLDPVTGSLLPGGEQAVTVPGNGTVEVSRTIDTTGYAWNDDGTPHTERNVTVAIVNGPSKSVPLTVRPKPVVLVHGVQSSAATWSAYLGTGFLSGLNVLWRAYAVGDGQVPGAMNTDILDEESNTVLQNAGEVARYVRGVRELTDAAQVDIVAHSMGGLLSRLYIQEFMPPAVNGRPVVSHLVMMGTPHLGSPCADVLTSVLQSRDLATAPIMELMPMFMSRFNQQVTQSKGVPFAGLIGNPLPATCQSPVAGDQVVPVASAKWELTDTATMSLLHTSMTKSPQAFSGFVKPRLALGPGAAGAQSGTTGREVTARRAAQATPSSSRKCVGAPRPNQVQLSGSLVRQLRGRATAGQTVRVSKAGKLSAVVIAPPTVTVRLSDPAGKVRSQSAAGSAGSDSPVRTLTVNDPDTGAWRLEFVNTSASSAQVAAGVIVGGSNDVLSASTRLQKQRGAVLVTAKARHGGSSVRGLRVSGRFAVPGGEARKLALRDNGRKSDRKAHDGTYTGTVRPAPSVDATITVQARGKRFNLTTLAGYCAG